jgi:ribosomal protein S18 acetylase RimI-like enzyme
MDHPRRLTPDDDMTQVHDLLIRCFAYMEGLIDPPSSLARMSADDLRQQAARAELWVMGDPPQACMILTPRTDTLYLGKLAVDATQRRRGLARRMIALALERAGAQNLRSVTLQTRVELTGNHATFRALGFVETGRESHAGFDHPTTVNFRRDI